MTRLSVYQSDEASPVDGCSGVYVVLASPTRMTAVEALRKAGFSAHKIVRADADSDEERVALDQPGVILWRDIWETPHRWHRM